MIRTFVLVTFLMISLCLVAPAPAEEETRSPTWICQAANLVAGKLTGYGKNFVEVCEERIRLCKDASIVDTEGNPITVQGLCATETVKVTLEGSCAREVQAIQIRR